MKNFAVKFFILCIFIFCLFSLDFLALANDNQNSRWKKLTDYIYIDRKSINIDKGWTYGLFKRMNSEEHNLYDIDGIPIKYELLYIGAYCTDDTLFLENIKLYDKNNKLLMEEPNKHNICARSSAYIDGELFFRTLCNENKD